MKNIKKILALGVTTLSMVFYTQFTFSGAESSLSNKVASGKTEYANARLGVVIILVRQKFFYFVMQVVHLRKNVLYLCK